MKKLLHRNSLNSLLIKLPFLFLFSWMAGPFHLTGQNPTNPRIILDNLLNEIEKGFHKYPDSTITLIDSAFSLIQNNGWEEDEIRVSLTLWKGIAISKLGNAQKALEQLNIAKLEASAIPDQYYTAKANYFIANFYSSLYQNEFSEPYLLEAIDFFDDNPSYEESGSVFQTLGKLRILQNDQENAQYNLQKAKEIFELQRDTVKLIAVMGDLGYSYNKLNLFEKGLAINRAALQLINNSSNPESFDEELSNIAVNYKTYDPDSAVILYEKAMEYAAANSDSLSFIISKYNYSNVLMDLQKLEKARRILEEVEDFCIRNKVQIGLTMVMLGYGQNDAQTGNYARAIETYENALKQMGQQGMSFFQMDIYESLFNWYSETGRSEDAALVKSILDSLTYTRNAKKLADLHTFSNQAMLAEKEAFDKLLLEKESAILNIRSKHQKTIFRAASLIVILASLFWSSILVIRRQRNVSAEVLLHQYRAENLSEGESTPNKSQLIEEAYSLRLLFEKDKIYLDPNLTMAQLQERLNLSYTDLHNIISQEFGLTFSSVVNNYRVEAAKKLLADPKMANLTIEEIASKCGFGTRQGFYKAFQKTTGVRLGDFRKYMLSPRK